MIRNWFLFSSSKPLFPNRTFGVGVLLSSYHTRVKEIIHERVSMLIIGAKSSGILIECYYSKDESIIRNLYMMLAENICQYRSTGRSLGPRRDDYQ